MVMRTKQRRQSRRGRWIVPCLAAGFLSYFSFHAVNGDLGLNASIRLDRKEAALKTKLRASRRSGRRWSSAQCC